MAVVDRGQATNLGENVQRFNSFICRSKVTSPFFPATTTGKAIALRYIRTSLHSRDIFDRWGTHENARFALVALIGLISLVSPNAVWADDIVVVNISETYNGNSVCGPSGGSLCSEVFNASFLWDNTTGTAVGGSLQFSAVGPLGTWGVILALVLDSLDNIVSLTAEGSFLDIVGFNFNLASNNLLPPGT